jgi:tetratricopeptide (TPR) repeat protein
VEGLPLGIELSASWVRLLSCSEIASEIKKGLELLSSTSKNVPERHRSLRAAFEQSWKLLTPKEQEVLRKLSVFAGGFRREAASEVAGAAIPLLASLVDKSLLRVLPNGRYDRHPLLYQFTREKLAELVEEQERTRADHADYFVKLAESIEPELRGKQQKEWLIHLEQEHENLRSVLAWTLEHVDKNVKGLQLAGALRQFWSVRGYFSEGRTWLDAFLAKDIQKGAAYLKALNSSAWFALMQGDYGVARSSYDFCLRLGQELEVKDIVASSLAGLGHLALERDDVTTARSFYEQSLALERAIKNDLGISACLNSLGNIADGQEDYVAARIFFEESLAIDRKLGNDLGIAIRLGNLGMVALEQRDVASARAYLHEALAIRKALGDKRGLAIIYTYVAVLEEKQGDYEKAKQLIMESLKIVVEIGYKAGAIIVLERLANLVARQKEFEHATLLWGSLEGLRETLGSSTRSIDKAVYERNVELAKTYLSHELFNKAWAKGKSLELNSSFYKSSGRMPSLRASRIASARLVVPSLPSTAET